MKLRDWIGIKFTTKIPKKDQKTYSLTVNQNPIDKVKVITHQTSGETIKLLQKYKTPRYDVFYLLRKKKGYNTAFFQQHYDIIVCDRNFKVIDLITDEGEGKISKYYPKGYFIYFTPVGSINHLSLKKYDRVRISRNWIKINI